MISIFTEPVSSPPEAEEPQQTKIKANQLKESDLKATPQLTRKQKGKACTLEPGTFLLSLHFISFIDYFMSRASA